MAANGLTPLLHPFESFMPSVGWQPSPALLTQVSPSAQAVIKTMNQHGRLWSSTIAASLRRLPQRTNALWQIRLDQASTDARSTETPGPIVEETVSFLKY